MKYTEYDKNIEKKPLILLRHVGPNQNMKIVKNS